MGETGDAAREDGHPGAERDEHDSDGSRSALSDREHLLGEHDAARMTIHVMLITPTAKRTSISAQQQPTHHAPCTIPIRSAPEEPLCQWCMTKLRGVRQWRRQTRFNGVSW